MNAPVVQADALVRLTQAARQLNVSYWTLWERCRMGEVEHNRIGKLIMLKQSTIDRILRESSRPRTAA